MTLKNQLCHIATQLIESGNYTVIKSAFSKNYVAHAGEKKYAGHGFLLRYAKQVHKALPDIKITGIEFLSTAGNRVTWQRSMSGTHRAPMRGIPASMKKVKWYEIVVTRFEKDLIAEEWLVSDLAFQLMLKQRVKK